MNTLLAGRDTPMDDSERIGHHESSHVVFSFRSGAGIPDAGIDLNAPASEVGARGVGGVYLFDHDTELPEVEQQKRLLWNLAIICAGPASDAKFWGCSPEEALRRQRGDTRDAHKCLDSSPLISTEDEKESVLKRALELAAQELEKPDVRDAIQKVARACLANGGRLTKAQIEEILQDLPI